MADQPTNPTQPNPPPETPPAAPTTPSNTGDTPGPVPYERFKEVNEQLKSLQAQLAKFEAAQKKEAERLAAEQGKWEDLAKQREAELQAEKTARLRLEVAARKGLPIDLVDRLKGVTVEEMETDAAALMAFLKPKDGPGVPPPTKSSTPSKLDFSKMTPEEIRKAVKGQGLNKFS